MRKISGQLLSSKPISLSRAAKLISRFAAVDNGSSPVVSLYLQRTADAFNNLVQFHSKRLRTSDVESSPDRKRAPKPPEDLPERNSNGAAAEDSNGGAHPNSVEVTTEERKRKKKSRSDSAVDDSKERSGNNPEANSSCVDEVQNGEKGEMKKKKKNKNKKSKSAEVGPKANSIGNHEIEVEYMQIEEKEQTKEENTKKIKKKKSHSAV
ncbi:PREDICTED: uncharacterized protein LOC105966017 [Erythranthe guttata]|uniref:uncharacterized protein LOC105966017 n=1 Tax=Erythranthe guttata TaxID=4155 RepID=UPI00064DA1E8|nr:PREDICTED: uncharacterized protein LOC105966017 [Erythranthe guttata]|eukprot:XP_012846014.1 PREDICTED: uncharacterized protein LOC105966017 [Erythranthe guttata]